MNVVVWEIDCDAVNARMYIQGESHAQMVEELMKRGFVRILRAELPYQDEPLAFRDTHGRLWDAMSVQFMFVGNLPDVKEMADNNKFKGAPL